MSTYGNRKERQDFQGAVCKSLIMGNLPGYAVKYFLLDIERLDMDSFRVFWGVRSFRKKLHLNEILQAKAVYHLFRNGLLVSRYQQPIRGGYTLGRIYTREVPTSVITTRSEIDQEIKSLCGRIDRPKNLSLLYNKIPMEVYTQSHESVHAIPKKGDLVYTQSHESVHAVVPKTSTSFDLKRTNLYRSSPKSKKKDLNYLKILKNKKANEQISADELKQYFVAVSRFENFTHEHHKLLAPFIEMKVTAGTLAKVGMAFKRVQRKDNYKGPYTEKDFNILLETVKFEHNKAQRKKKGG